MKITLSLSEETVGQGGTVQGIVRLISKESPKQLTKLKSFVWVQICGESRVKFRSSHGRILSEKRRFFSKCVIIQDEAETLGETTKSPEPGTLVFHAELPSSLPYSFEGELGSIKYWIRAKSQGKNQKTRRKNRSEKQDLIILPATVAQYKAENPSTIDKYFSKNFFPAQSTNFAKSTKLSKHAQLSVTLPKGNVISPGNLAAIRIGILRPEKVQALRLKVTKQSFWRVGKCELERKIRIFEDHFEILSNEKYQITAKFEIPRHEKLLSLDSKCCTVKYSLEVCALSYFDPVNVKVVVPLIVLSND